MSIEHNVVSVSGGKDSTALLLLAIERQTEKLQVVFADTGHEHPQTYDYVGYLEQVTGIEIRWVRADFTAQIERKRSYVDIKWREEGMPDDLCDQAIAALQPTGNPFLDLCLWKGRFPSTKARFCSEELKKNPIVNLVQRPLMEAGDDVISWQGVRADESPSRALLKEMDCNAQLPNGAELWNYRPILKWSVQDVFTMHDKHGVKPNPLYAQGMGRVGCMPCIHCRKDELLEIHRRFPEEIERVAEWERLVAVASKRGASSFFVAADGRGDNIVEAVEWSKTSRGGVQYDLIRTDRESMPLCSSIYGLCE